MDSAAPVLPAVPEEGPAGSWLTDETGAGYGPPTTTEILPDFLLSEEAVKFVESNPELYISWSTRSMFKWAIGLTISRRLSDMALKHVTGFNSSTQALPFEATWDEGPQPDTSNAPHLTWVPWIGASRSNIQMPWLGCRCSWPCTQLCWWNCIACGCYQHVAIIWCIITLYFEFILLDAMVVQDFIAKVPDRITSWDDYATLQKPLSSKIAIIFIYLIFPWFVVGYLWGRSIDRAGNLNSYFPSLYQARIMLRSVAARYEGNGYGFCTVIFWAILLEIHTVIIPAYLPFITPAIVLQHYEGSLHNIAKLYIVISTILTFQEYSLYFAEFVLCLQPATIALTTRCTAGNRALREWYSMQYVYLWVLVIDMLLIIILSKWKLSMLWLWIVPITVIVYAFVIHGMSYCMNGIAVCPPHTGPAIVMAQIGTTLTFLFIFFWTRGCFLFPCLCAPEVPGWVFFPPEHPPSDPLQGDIDVSGFIILLDKASRGFPPVEDCVWTPPARPFIEPTWLP